MVTGAIESGVRKSKNRPLVLQRFPNVLGLPDLRTAGLPDASTVRPTLLATIHLEACETRLLRPA